MMTAEHRRPLFAYAVVALAAALMIGQGLNPTSGLLDAIMGDQGVGRVHVASSVTISAGEDSDSGEPVRSTSPPALAPAPAVQVRRSPDRPTRPVRAADRTPVRAAGQATPATATNKGSTQGTGSATKPVRGPGKSGKSAKSAKAAGGPSARTTVGTTKATGKGHARATAKTTGHAKKAKRAKRA